MSEHPPRPPTKAETKVSPLAEVTKGNLYPYWDLNESGLNPYLNAIRRTFAWINPFSHQQIPTSERAAVGIREGPRYYKEDVCQSLLRSTPIECTSTPGTPATTIP